MLSAKVGPFPFLNWPTLLAVQSISWINIILRYVIFVEHRASKLKLGSFNEALHTEYNGATFISISEILVK